MSHSKKAKAAGVSASSFLDLKAEIVKQEAEFAKSKASGVSYTKDSAQRPDKKPPAWLRSNKGVKSRMARDVQMEELSKKTVESTREALERKARLYDKLKKGKTGGLSEEKYKELLVDFDAKVADDHFSSDSDDVDESLTVPKPPEEEDDPIVEYEDEFGRIRTARRSEVPRTVLEQQRQAEEDVEDDPFVIYNPVNHFPVFEPSAERLAAIHEAARETPVETHYDASHEVRAKGAGFYAFSADEQKRQQEMEELKRARDETEKARREAGAVDVKTGEVEGMIAGPSIGGDGGKIVSRAAEKRKREIEERRRLLEEKRKKIRGNTETSGDQTISSSQVPDSSQPIASSSKLPTDSFAGLERHSQPAHAEPAPAAFDPFAQVEAQSRYGRQASPAAIDAAKSIPVTKSAPLHKLKKLPKGVRDGNAKELSSADAFLRDLEKDLTGM